MSKKNKPALTLTGTTNVVAIVLLVATLYGFLGRFHWFLDLFSHFRVQYLQLSLPLIGIYLWKRKNVRAWLVVLLALVNYSFVLPLYFGKPHPTQHKPARAMLVNLNARNGNTAQVLAAIRAASPDLLLLQEVTPKWAQELKVLEKDYKYRIAEPRDDCFGIMLLGKYPLEHGKVVEIGNTGVPSIIAETHFPDGVISVIGTHPVPPINGSYAQKRNLQLMELPYVAANQKHPVLLMGDLNTTPFSYWFKRVQELGLKNSMKGFGFQPTWRGNRFMKIPLDHVLHTPEIVIHNRVVGGDVGSDHLPVIVDFSLH
jgi:endonuclease/exonuclease/phosphatase (EEP) superfamily protein YafD